PGPSSESGGAAVFPPLPLQAAGDAGVVASTASSSVCQNRSPLQAGKQEPASRLNRLVLLLLFLLLFWNSSFMQKSKSKNHSFPWRRRDARRRQAGNDFRKKPPLAA